MSSAKQMSTKGLLIFDLDGTLFQAMLLPFQPSKPCFVMRAIQSHQRKGYALSLESPRAICMRGLKPSVRQGKRQIYWR